MSMYAKLPPTRILKLFLRMLLKGTTRANQKREATRRKSGGISADHVVDNPA